MTGVTRNPVLARRGTAMHTATSQLHCLSYDDGLYTQRSGGRGLALLLASCATSSK